jgi:hypothetical protein
LPFAFPWSTTEKCNTPTRTFKALLEEEDAFFSTLTYFMFAVDQKELRDLYVPCDPPDVAASSHATQQLKGDSSLELLGLNRHLPETSKGAISH